MEINEIIQLVITIVVFLCTVASFIFALVKKAKQLKAAKTDTERSEIYAEMKNLAVSFIQEAEDFYYAYDSLLKQTGGSAGADKKDRVMQKLQLAAMNFGIPFDADYWSNVVESLVSLTKGVNAKTAAEATTKATTATVTATAANQAGMQVRNV